MGCCFCFGLFGLVWFLRGIEGELLIFYSYFFSYSVSGNGTHNSSTGQFTHKENVSS